MKIINKVSAALALFVGLYAFGRNNLFLLDGVTFFASPYPIFKLLVPMLIAFTGLLLFRGSRAVKIGALVILFVDLIYRAYELYSYFFFSGPVNAPPPEEKIITVTINLWPLIMLVLTEIICIALILSTIYLQNRGERITS